MPRTVEWSHQPADEGLDPAHYDVLRALEEGRVRNWAPEPDTEELLLDLEAAGLTRYQIMQPVVDEVPFEAWVVTDRGRQLLLRVGSFREQRATLLDQARDYSILLVLVALLAILAMVAL